MIQWQVAERRDANSKEWKVTHRNQQQSMRPVIKIPFRHKEIFMVANQSIIRFNQFTIPVKIPLEINFVT